MKYLSLALLLLFCPAFSNGQQDTIPHICGSSFLDSITLNVIPDYLNKEKTKEKLYRKDISGFQRSAGAGVCTLPVVVHVIHENGTENISDAQVMDAIGYLNDAFRNTGFYNPDTGTDTEIGFCLAQRDPEGNPTNGIVRHQSPLTDMSAPYSHADVTALATWPVLDYINIRVVKTVCLSGWCAPAGYAFMPPSHGWEVDGIVVEAAYMGESPENTSVLVHEMGHYLGLLHTFSGGCTNGDCLADGDRVCDTPPDNSNGAFACGFEINSCNSDEDDVSPQNPFRPIVMGGLGDQPDEHRNYMDYGFQFCKDRFSEGQKERMHFMLENARGSLLGSKACLPPCPDEPVAQFSLSGTTVEAGEDIFTNNLSANVDAYEWFIDGISHSFFEDTVFNFGEEGTYSITLVADNSAVECGQDTSTILIEVLCPIIAELAYQQNGSWLVFTDVSSFSTSSLWTVKDGDGTLLFTSSGMVDSLETTGLEYIQICLESGNGICTEQVCEYILLIQPGTEICNNQIDDDGDGFVDLFDQDCACDDGAFQAFCPIDCEYTPDSFPSFEMQLKWESEVISINNDIYPNIVTGDIDGDGFIEVITKKSTGNWINGDDVYNTTIILDGMGGNTLLDFEFTPDLSFNLYSAISMADVDHDGFAEMFSHKLDTIFCFGHDGTLLWKSEKLKDFREPTVNTTDFNGDGIPELYVGDEIINSLTGKILVNGSGAGGCNPYDMWVPCTRRHTVAADLLPTPGLELAAGNTVYQVELSNLDGTAGNILTPVYAPVEVSDGFTSIGDINMDGELDVIVVRGNNDPNGGGIWVWDPRTQEIIAKADAGEIGGVAFIGDVDGDCTPEIGMVFREELRMYKYDGTQDLQLLYNLPTTDGSGFTGLTMFDFNQDGKQELVYRDETDLRILKGSTGNTLASWPMKSGTGMEYPIVADVDNDGEAEILVHGYQSDTEVDIRVYCFESAGAPWAPARSVWNQYGYHVTNVNDDLTIPREQQNQAAVLEGHENCLQPTCPAPYNAFLSQATYRTQEGCVQFPAVDLAVDILDYSCAPDSFSVCLEVRNQGSRSLTDDLSLTFYLEDPILTSNAQILESLTIPFNDTLGVDSIYADILCYSFPLPSGAFNLYVAVNDGGGQVAPLDFPVTNIFECEYGNNVTSIALDFNVPALYLGLDMTKCESEVISLNAGSGFVSYLWNDNTQDSIYSSSFEGPHFVEVVDQCGRVQSDTVFLTITQADDVDLGDDIEACPNDTVSFSLPQAFDFASWMPSGMVDCDSCLDVTITADSSFSLIVLAGYGDCLSSDTVVVEFSGAVFVEEGISICEGDSLFYMGSVLSSDGIYEFALNGCDSILLLDLTLDNADTVMIDEVICEGDSIFFGGAWYHQPGDYVLEETNVQGCDSLVLFRLEVVEEIQVIDTLEVCEGDSVNILGFWISSDTMLSEAYTSFAGCDSIYSATVTVLPYINDTVSYSLCQGDSIFIGNEWIFGEGKFDFIVDAQTGCDTALHIDVFEVPPLFNSDTVAICEGDSIEISGQYVFGDILMSQTFSAFSGCDSIQSFQVVSFPLVLAFSSYSICDGDSVFVGTEWYSGEGSYQTVLPAQVGCDTLLDFEINEIPNLSNLDTVSICEGDSTFIFGQWVFNDTLLEETFTSVTGCDSTQFFHIEVAPQVYAYQAVSLCPGDSILVGTEWLSEEGIYPILISSPSACDTLLEVEITELETVHELDSITVCEGDSVLIFGAFESSAGVYTDSFVGHNGCDSIQTFYLETIPFTFEFDTIRICEGDSIFIGGQWVNTSGVYIDTIPTSPCSTVSSTLVEMEENQTTESSIVICPGDSLLVGNDWVFGPGSYELNFGALNGCDSTHILNVSQIEDPAPPSASVDCENMEVLVSIEAGMPWEIFWDNGQSSTSTVYEGGGIATVNLSSSLPSCEKAFSINLPEIPSRSDLLSIQDTSIKIGQDLNISLDLAPHEWTVVWSPSEIFSCDSCMNTVVSPLQTTTIDLYYIHESGCIYRNSFEVRIQKDADIYIPNAFSPNNDGINDLWRVFPQTDIEVFDEVRIYSRWGSLVASWRGVPEVAWDGTFKGEPMNPAVFVYYIRYTDSSGKKVEKKGDVNLLR